MNHGISWPAVNPVNAVVPPEVPPVPPGTARAAGASPPGLFVTPPIVMFSAS